MAGAPAGSPHRGRPYNPRMPPSFAVPAPSEHRHAAPLATAEGWPLVVCADDYGMSEAVSQAILALAAQARLSATSAMVLSPHWPAHAAWLQACRGQLDVGLHLDWTSAFAMVAGHGMPLGRLMLRALTRRLDPAQVRQAIAHQLDLFEQHWGSAPDHVDGHQHVHQFPVIREQLVQVLTERYPDQPRPWLRISRPLQPGRDLKARIIGAMGATALSQLASRAGFVHSARLTGIYDFDGDRAGYVSHLDAWLAQARLCRSVVLMCHPGGAAPVADDEIAMARTREWDVLLSDEWPRLLQAHGLRLVRGMHGLS